MLFEPGDLADQKARIVVVGVGGGGGNALNRMIVDGMNAVEFIAINTDAQDLEFNNSQCKLQIGKELTKGLGAGANSEVGNLAVEENREVIIKALETADMVFITAGMGGGTGTGAAPFIAKIANEKNILTVGVVTVPFSTEGGNRKEYAKEGLKELRENVDTLLVINNDKLIQIYGDLTLSQAFAKANEVLNTATKGIAEVISQHLLVNIDLNDARRVLEKSGTAVMGQATASGENRAIEAVVGALDSPLLNDNNINGAKQVLLKIVTGEGEDEIRMLELANIKQKIQEAAGGEVNIIEGIGIDSDLSDEVCITVIATGFEVRLPKDDLVINLDDDNSIEEIIENNLEIDLKESEKLAQEHKAQQSIFDDIQNVEDEVYLKMDEDKLETKIEADNKVVEERLEPGTEIELDIEKKVVDLDSDIGLPDDLIPTLKHEETGTKEPMDLETKEPIDLETKEEVINQTEESLIDQNVLTNKSREREERLRKISLKLRTPSGLTDLEDEPAYKRDNLELEDTPHSSESEVSRYTLSEGEDNKMEIKPNNSFLHDNVD